MYERFENIKKRRAKISSFSTSKFDKPAVTLGGYKLNVGGGIYDADKAEYVEVGNQDAQVVVDYPFPGKFPSLEKNQIVLKPISAPRTNWETAFEQMRQNNDDTALIPDVFEEENTEEWT